MKRCGPSLRITASCDQSHSTSRRRRLGGSQRSVMEKSYSYRLNTHWTQHKRGIIEGESIPRTINFAAPPEFGGEPGLWTPEHLLVASVSTCFVSTFRAVAEASKFEFDGVEVETEGTIEKLESGFRFTKVVLKP